MYSAAKTNRNSRLYRFAFEAYLTFEREDN